MKMRYLGKCLLLEDERKENTGKNEKVLVVGDLHLGYEEALNKAGVFVSRQMFEEMISDLNLVFGEVGHVNKVILLGDIKHDFGGILKQEWRDVTKILDYFSSMADKVIVIRGNHDTMLEPILKKKKMKLRDYYIWKEFCFLHGDSDFEFLWDRKRGSGKEIEYLVVGHGHPAVRLNEGVKSEKYKCFLVGKFRGKNLIVVPSFIDYYVGSDPREGEIVLAWDIDFGNFDVKVVPVAPGELEVLDFGKLKRLK